MHSQWTLMYMDKVHIQFVSVHDSQHSGWREAAPSKLSHAHTPPGRVMPYTAISDLYLTEHLQRSTHPSIPGSGHSDATVSHPAV
jgi:hypothetical protein